MPIFKRFLFIILLTLAALVIDLPATYRPFLPSLTLGNFSRDLEIKQGLDIKGGAHLVLETDMSGIEASSRNQALQSAKEVISRRVDLFGVSEPVIQTAIISDTYRIIVELPGIQAIDQAVALIGQTAQLDFREDLSVEASPSAFMFATTGLTGKDLLRSAVTFANPGATASEPVVSLEFTPDGAAKFKDLTARNVNRPIAIFLDDQLITAPIVNQVIDSGQAIISGNFTPESASQLAIQLNAGALPVPIKIVEQKNISATLGADSIRKSLMAGIVGLSLVMLFMVLLYGVNGLIADTALLIYGLLTLAIYKLIPVTLTLPGIAGFILSVGMAVDSNILIFERLKEELRRERPFAVALQLGFGRAWDSIKDANVATIVTSLILINPFNFSFLNSSGLVRGFALTLLIGVLISLFTGIVVTRTFMRLFYAKKIAEY